MRLGVDPVSRRVDEQSLSSALYEVSVRLPNEALASLYNSALGPAISQAATDQNWWFRRTEYLIRREIDPSFVLQPRIGDWSFIYKSLSKYGYNFNWRPKYTSLLVSVLLELGADPLVFSGVGFVAETGDLEALKTIVADPRVTFRRDHSTLRRAVSGGNLDNVMFLLADRRVPVPRDLCSGAVEYYNVPMLKLLLSDERIDPSAENNDALLSAIKYDYTDIVVILLEDDRVVQAVTDDWEELLVDAVEHGHLEVVKVILRYNSDYILGAALLKACRLGRADIVKIILPEIGDPDREHIEVVLTDGMRIAKNLKNEELLRLLEEKMAGMGFL